MPEAVQDPTKASEARNLLEDVVVVVVAVHPQDSDTQLLAPGVNAIRELIARLVTVESKVTDLQDDVSPLLRRRVQDHLCEVRRPMPIARKPHTFGLPEK